MSNMGERIRMLRESLHMTQEEFKGRYAYLFDEEPTLNAD